MQLSLRPEQFADEGCELAIAGKMIRVSVETGGYQVEIDGISMFLPTALVKAG